MEIKNVKNIVFYKYLDENNNEKVETCIFFDDGNTKTVPYEEGLKICTKKANDEKINSKEALKELVNNGFVHVMSGAEFKKSYNKFVNLSTNDVKDVINNELKTVEVKKDSLGIGNKPHAKAAPVVVKDKPKTKKRNRVIASLLGLAILATGGHFALAKNKTGKMITSNIKNVTSRLIGGTGAYAGDLEENNELYDNYTFDKLQQVTLNQTQKAEMKRIHDALHGYNVEFAKHYIEADKDIKAALTWEEVVALSQGYNDFSPNEIRAIFNGTTIRAKDLDSAYKTATLQLMGAHVIEDRAHPVDMSGIFIKDEGVEFYNKYHKLFLDAKEADGDDKVAAVEKFYKELRTDFPITEDVREVGIAHKDSRDSIESYKLSVTPMVAAAEMIFQNLDIDHTLKGGVINYFLGDSINFENLEMEDIIAANGVKYGDLDYFNDLGLCNYAEEKFEIVQQITMGDCANLDTKNPTYQQYKNATVKELKDLDSYYIDDAHRELSQLDKFQDTVNWHFDIDEDGYYTGEVWYETNTYTQTKTWKESKTTYRTETTRVEKPIPASEKAKIDSKIRRENEKAKAEGERKAEENRKQMQKEEDEKAKEIRKEVEEDAKDMQDKIDNANEQIDNNNKDNDTSNNKPVNENDFGDHNVDFDDNHSDDNGNLDNSVEDITTDGTGAKTENDLPDPNETGAEFDKKGESSSNNTQSAPAPKQESAPAPKQESAPAPKVESAPAPKSNEQAVNDYVEKVANESSQDDDEKVLTKE